MPNEDVLAWVQNLGVLRIPADSDFPTDAFAVESLQMVYDGVVWKRVRGGNLIGKDTLANAAGNTALWTPAANTKFRLLAFLFFIPGNSTLGVAGTDVIRLHDGATPIVGTHWRPFIPGAAANVFGGAAYGPIILPPNGYISVAANNVLNVNLGTALAVGNVVANAWGIEE